MSEWKPSCTQDVLQYRARINHTIRAFFIQRKVLEVETPALSQTANTDPHIESFHCKGIDATGKAERYLHTSPEYPMKRLLAAGCGDIYQLTKVWRANEVGRQHNPEFTLLEWYRLDFTYHQLMQEVETLLCDLIPDAKRNETQKISYQQAFINRLGIDPHTATREALYACVQTENIQISANLDRSALLDILMTHCVEASFPKRALSFIYDYPADQSALARVREGNPAIAERFEVYLGSLELGNGYQELQDADKNTAVLHAEQARRRKYRVALVPQDKKFLAAMQYGLPFCSGGAWGGDRILMAALHKKSIREVISFAWDIA
jgi:lysyl-tRNA synthetase class 2